MVLCYNKSRNGISCKNYGNPHTEMYEISHKIALPNELEFYLSHTEKEGIMKEIKSVKNT